MTTKELVALLLKLPQDADVYFCKDEDDLKVCEVGLRKVEWKEETELIVTLYGS